MRQPKKTIKQVPVKEHDPTPDEASPDGGKVFEILHENAPSACPVKKIRILGKEFAVKRIDDSDAEVDGRTYMGSQELHYRIHSGVEYNRDTVLHEVTHALETSLDLGLTERQVQLLATGLLAVLSDNKEFTKWLIA